MTSVDKAEEAASGNLPQVAAKQIDIGYPSPGVLTSSVDAGVPIISIWEQYPAQVFDFVLNGKSKITHPRQLRGKTIAIFTDIWRTIVNPMLVEVGVDPKSVKYGVFGPQWVQAVALGQADAGLVPAPAAEAHLTASRTGVDDGARVGVQRLPS
jgi:NitT/TauT family transport system substrate-binding protein